MCEIHFVKRFDGKLQFKEIGEFDKILSEGSLSNPDGWGIFSKSTFAKGIELYQSNQKILLPLMQDEWVIGHNRFATSENVFSYLDYFKDKEIMNAHPFELNNLILVHNGIIHNDIYLREKYKIRSKISTDSYTILWMINHFMNSSKSKDRSSRLVQGIKLALEEIKGTFSIFLYDKISNDLYYFKDDFTQFTFKIVRNTLYGTTKESIANSIYLSKFKEKIIPIPYKIYKIQNIISSPLKIVGTINHKVQFTYPSKAPKLNDPLFNYWGNYLNNNNILVSILALLFIPIAILLGGVIIILGQLLKWIIPKNKNKRKNNNQKMKGGKDK